MAKLNEGLASPPSRPISKKAPGELSKKESLRSKRKRHQLHSSPLSKRRQCRGGITTLPRGIGGLLPEVSDYQFSSCWGDRERGGVVQRESDRRRRRSYRKERNPLHSCPLSKRGHCRGGITCPSRGWEVFFQSCLATTV